MVWSCDRNRNVSFAAIRQIASYILPFKELYSSRAVVLVRWVIGRYRVSATIFSRRCVREHM